ncbi:MAG: hypothetical protein FJ121_04500 [Deltaproteobacteria bacterium]|nr:hypothetical protein [Deltaproteobacteria bacterium]
MPYYVYRIHTDNRDNHLVNYFEYFSDAQKFEENLKSVRHLEGHDYFITMFFAENDREAEIKANDLRPHPKLL